MTTEVIDDGGEAARRRRRLPLLLSLFCVVTTGCTRRLLIQPDDGTALRVAKVTARVPLAVVSFGMSEVMASCVSNTAAREGWPTTPESPAWDVCNGRIVAGAMTARQSQQRCTTTCTPGVTRYDPTRCETRCD